MKITDWFENENPVFTNEYATDAFGRKTKEIFNEERTAPQFVFLSLNAPHDPVLAKPDLREQYREMFPDMSEKRLELLATVRAIDIQMEEIVKTVSKLKRETLIVFQSDNGGRTATLSAKKGSEKTLNSCNFPFKGKGYRLIHPS